MGWLHIMTSVPPDAGERRRGQEVSARRGGAEPAHVHEMMLKRYYYYYISLNATQSAPAWGETQPEARPQETRARRLASCPP